ncbi:phosphatidylethanolamine N-methyltransferase-like [Amphiura filiformis]|uniref:phosphatidylethanolamine N-methyltransferase-like n=1 Tax=Amphiura filiformis TaxID=82378 RepID=UPI003B227CCB
MIKNNVFSECCDGLSRISWDKMELPKALTCNPPQIDWSDTNLYITGILIIFNPLFWNCVARYEYRTHFLTKLFMGPKIGCTLLAGTIFFLGTIRLRRYQLVIESHPQWALLVDNIYAQYIAYAFILFGSVLILASFYALGLFGTYLGDYFGILMKERVTCFPFNIMDNPMYWGTVLDYLGSAIWHASPAGLLLTVLLAICYKIAILFEEPFTAEIYRQKAKKEKNKKES